ncbi:MAG: hypothetical protein ACYTG1_11235 [Planctomycetota bacterium]|jgi:hypothetical protein
MNEIRHVLRMAARRIELGRYLGCLHVAAVVLATAGLGLIVADRLPAAAFVPWTWVVPVLAVLAVAAAGLVWWRRRRDEIEVAMSVDERLDLREKFSTALHCAGRDDAFAQAALADAVTAARDRRVHERVRRLFRVAPPRGWWASPLIVLAAFMLSLLGQLDAFSDEEPAPAAAVVKAKLAAEDAVEAVIREIEDKPALSKELEDLLGDLTEHGTDFDGARPEQIKRDAIKKVTDITRKLDELLSGEKGKTADAIERSLQQLRPPEDGAAKDLGDSLARGDFKAAKKALEEMMDKLQKGELNEEQQKKLAEQLQQMADQLEQLARQQQQLEKALEQAGLDPRLAQNPQALQQALEDNPNLNQQQIQQIKQMAQAQQAAAQACQGLGQAAAGMAQGMMNGELGQMGEGAQAMAGQLDALEQMQMLLMEAEAAAGACQGQCQGLGQGLAMKPGGAFGQRGQGAGGKAPIAPTPTRTKLVKEKTKLDPTGEIIARQLFEGPQVRGESKAALREVAAAVREGYDEALNEEQLPRRYHDPQLHYFGELQKLTEAIEAETGGEDDAGDDAGDADAEGGDAGEAGAATDEGGDGEG